MRIWQLQLFIWMFSHYKLNWFKMTVISLKTHANLYNKISHSGQLHELEVQRLVWLFCQKETQAAGKRLHNMVGRFRWRPCQSSGSHFLSFCSRVRSTCQASFYCHKGCIHLNWKKYVGKNCRPDSCAETQETVSLIFRSRVVRFIGFKTYRCFACCSLLLCLVQKLTGLVLVG